MGSTAQRPICRRCGRHPAASEADVDRFHKIAGLDEFRGLGPPPIPVAICFACIRKDPVLKGALETWLASMRNKLWWRPLRDAIARPLEAIDEFVEHFR
jgi:hypothetical protein